MEQLLLIPFALGLGYCAYQWQIWKARAFKAHSQWREADLNFETIKGQWNRLDDERRRNHDAIMETFEVLNELPDNPDRWPVEQLRQCRNVLLFALQNSTYRRDND